MENQTNLQLAQMSAPIPFSQKLLQCIAKLDTGEKMKAKLELVVLTSELMPNGKPNFLSVIKYPMIKSLITTTEGKMRLMGIVTLLIKDFCSSFNVVRNMNENQMIEAASMLLDECDNFRLEDYVMMFQMGKRGELFNVHDRIDLQVITAMLDKYWEIRHKAGENEIVTEINHIDTMGNTSRLGDIVAMQDMKLMELGSGFSSALTDMKKLVEEKVGNKEERAKLREIEQADTEAIRKRKQEMGYDD